MSVPNSGSAAPPPPVWDAHPAAPALVTYGGFWIRLVAYIIDSVLLSFVGAVIGGVFGGAMAIGGGNGDSISMGGGILGLVIAWLYFALMESSERGATVGKMALGLRVVTDKGERLSFMNATGRYFAKILSALILCIGFIMIAFTDRKRGLHDMIANTLVIKTR
ncbi:MAG: RDD family protein [Reyranella sp.]|nr:RDD family protein [Reyranella sp.]